MNRYGYFTFEDFPTGVIGTISIDYNVQLGAEDLVQYDRFAPANYHDYASFEKGQFDFEKPLYIPNSANKISHVSRDLSDEDGYFSNIEMFTVFPDVPCNGSGFSLLTYNEDYTVVITVNDENGTETKTFEKTEDEFFPFPYNGLTSVTFGFRRIEPYRFLKVVGYSFGAVRRLTENDLIGEPEIVNHFSITGEELEYDTLDLTIHGSKENFNIQTGERITHSTTKQAFYVNNCEYNENGTISISCYDHIARLEKLFTGLYANTRDTDTWIENLIKGGYSGVNVNMSYPFLAGQQFEGLIEIMPYREALQMLLCGTAYRLQRSGDIFNVFCPQKQDDFDGNFTVDDIVSDPQITTHESINKVTFVKYKYKKDKTDGRVEMYHDSIEADSVDSQMIYFNEPAQNLKYYYVVGTADDEDILQEIDGTGDGFVVVRSGVNFVEVNCTVEREYVIKGYPFRETERNLVVKGIRGDTTFYQDDVDISDCTVIISLNDYKTFKSFLRFVYKYNVTISLDSIKFLDAGDRVKIYLGKRTFSGWITLRRNNLNGVYGYEVACNELE